MPSINSFSHPLSPLSCDQVVCLLGRMAADDPTIARQEADAFAIHVASCRECEQMFYRSAGMNEDGSFTPDDQARHAQVEPELMTVEEGWRDLLEHCPDLAVTQDQQLCQEQRRRWRYRISKITTAAAALALVCGIGWQLWRGPAKHDDSLLGNAHASTNGARLPLPTVSVTSPADASSLGFLQSNGLPIAAVNIDALDYAQWQESQRDWFIQQFPWIFQSQVALEEKGIHADYLDLLVLSGDIWQFHYQSGGSIQQPLTRAASKSLVQLAHHFAVDPNWLCSKVLRDERSSILSRSESTDATTTTGMEQWRSDLIAAMNQPYAVPTDLLLRSVPVVDYLSHTRTAVYLWAKAHPHESPATMTDGIRGIPLATSTAARRALQITRLRQRATAAHEARQVEMQWLLVQREGNPIPDGCMIRPAHPQQLAALLNVLLLVTSDLPQEEINQ